MTELDIRTEQRDGWQALRGPRLSGLVRGDASLLDRLRGESGLGDVDDVLDVLSAEGVRRMPDLVLLAESADGPARVVARGSAYAVLRRPDGTAEVRHRGRTPWVDEDLPEDVTAVELVTGEPDEPEPIEEAPPAPAAQGAQDWAPGALSTTVSGPLAEPMEEASSAPARDGATTEAQPQERPRWRAPSRFGRRVDESTPRDPSITPRERVRSAPGEEAVGRAETEEVEELPSYDHLFGATQQGPPRYLQEVEDEEQDDAPIDSGPVASVGGHVPDAPSGGDLTLPPPAEDAGVPEPPSAAPRTPSALPAAARSSEPASPQGEPSAPGLIASVPWAKGAASDAPRKQTPPPSPPTPPDTAPYYPERRGGSERDSAQYHPEGRGEVAPVEAAQPPPPPVTSAGETAYPPDDDVEATVDRSALMAARAGSDGPSVLAVLCPAGHLSPPHATTCRMCGRDVPEQQPFQTGRPVLGVLRMPSGDAVQLDRGVLLGRSPRVNPDLDAASTPHLVRVPSPENDVSRTHAEIVLDGWHVLVRDLGSTNGTTIALPGTEPVRLRPDDQVELEPGAVLTLAEQVSMTFEVPA